MNVLHVYNINYKIKIKYLKYELTKIISRESKHFKIKMSNSYPGQCWIHFDCRKEMLKTFKILNEMLFFKKKLIVQKKSK